MAKSWKEVIASEGYQSLPEEEKAAAQDAYFNSVVAPKLKPEQLEPAKAEFYSTYPSAKMDQSADKDPTWGQVLSAYANKGLTETLGFPVDAVNQALDVFGLKSNEPVAGSKWFKEVFGEGGIETDLGEIKDRKKRMLGRVVQEVGATVVPLMGVAAKAKASIAPAKAIIKKDVPKTVAGDVGRQAPTEMTGIEAAKQVGLAASAGAGAGVAMEMFPDEPLAEMAGQLIGGTAPTAGVVAGKYALSRANMLKNVVMQPLTPKKVEETIRDQLEQSMLDHPVIRQNMDQADEVVKGIPGFKPSTAEAAADPVLLGIQRSSAAKQATTTGKEVMRRAENNKAINNALATFDAEEGMEVTQDIVQSRLARTQNFINSQIAKRDFAYQARINKSQNDVDEIIESIKPHMDKQEAGRTAWNELQGQYNKFRIQASNKYDALEAIDPSITVGRIKEVSKNIVKGRGKISQKGDVPEVAFEIDELYDEVESFSELRSLRSRVLADIRSEKSANVPNYQKIRHLNTIKDSVEESIDSLSKSPDSQVAELYRDASKFYREGMERFRQGTARQILKPGPAGERSALADSNILGKYFVKGAEGKEKIAEFKKTFGNSAEAAKALDDHIANDLMDVMDYEGSLNLTRLQAWLSKHKEAFAELPEIRSKYSNLAKAKKNLLEVTDKAAKEMKRLGARKEKFIRETDRNIARLYLDNDPSKVMSRVLSSRNPYGELSRTLRLVKGDEAAIRGIRRAFVDELKKKSASTGVDIAGVNFLKPGDMKKFLNAHQRELGLLYKPHEIKKLWDIQKATEMMHRSTVGQLGGSDTTEKAQGIYSLNQLLSRVYAAHRGVVSWRYVQGELLARLGQKIWGTITDTQAKSLLEEALYNPQVAKDLMTKPTVKNAEKLQKAFRAHLAALGPTTIEEEAQSE